MRQRLRRPRPHRQFRRVGDGRGGRRGLEVGSAQGRRVGSRAQCVPRRSRPATRQSSPITSSRSGAAPTRPPIQTWRRIRPTGSPRPSPNTRPRGGRSARGGRPKSEVPTDPAVAEERPCESGSRASCSSSPWAPRRDRREARRRSRTTSRSSSSACCSSSPTCSPRRPSIRRSCSSRSCRCSSSRARSSPTPTACAARAGPILALALPGVAISLLGTAGVATFALGLPFSVALLLGALLAITDTVSVLLAFRSDARPASPRGDHGGREPLQRRHGARAREPRPPASSPRALRRRRRRARASCLAIVGGVAVGAAFGAVGAARAAAHARSPHRDPRVRRARASRRRCSPSASTRRRSSRSSSSGSSSVAPRAAPSSRRACSRCRASGRWSASALNVLLFLLVGMQIDARMLVAEAGAIAPRRSSRCTPAAPSRSTAASPCCALLRRERVPLRWQHVMVFGNIKGALSMAAVLALPAALPHRERLITIVFGVTFVTLVTQALPFRRVLQRRSGRAGVARRHRSTRAGDAHRGAPRPARARRAARDGPPLAPRARRAPRRVPARRSSTPKSRCAAAGGRRADDDIIDAARARRAEGRAARRRAPRAHRRRRRAEREIAGIDRALIALAHGTTTCTRRALT